jgi:O-antigen/teichoic acid export membrane protein
METLASRFLSSAKWLSALNLLQTIFRFAVGIVLARLILPGAFGEYAFMLALVEGMTVIIGFGINTSIIQNDRYPAAPFQNSGFFVAAGLTLGYASVATAAGWLFLRHLFYPYLLILIAKVVFMLSGVHAVVLQKQFQFKAYSLIQFVSFLVSSATAIVLALRGHGLHALVVQYLVVQVLSSVLIFAVSPYRVNLRSPYQRDHVATFFRNGKKLFVSHMFEKVMANADKLAIRLFYGAPVLGLFNRSVGLIQGFQSMFLTVQQPLLTVSFADLQGDRDRSSYFFNTSAWVMLRASLLITLVFASAAAEFILLLYGPAWIEAAPMVPLVAVFVMLAPLKSMSRSFLLSNGYFRTINRIQMAEVLLLFGALSLGGYYGGVYGICLGLSVWMAFGVAIYIRNIAAIITVNITRLFLVPAIMVLAVPWLIRQLKIHDLPAPMAYYWRGGFSLILVLVLFVATVLVFERDRIEDVLRRIGLKDRAATD